VKAQDVSRHLHIFLPLGLLLALLGTFFNESRLSQPLDLEQGPVEPVNGGRLMETRAVLPRRWAEPTNRKHLCDSCYFSTVQPPQCTLKTLLAKVTPGRLRLQASYTPLCVHMCTYTPQCWHKDETVQMHFLYSIFCIFYKSPSPHCCPVRGRSRLQSEGSATLTCQLQLTGSSARGPA